MRGPAVLIALALAVGARALECASTETPKPPPSTAASPARVRAPATPPPDAGPPTDSELARDIRALLQDRTIEFAYNQADIRPESMKDVERIAALLISKHAGVRIRVEVHTDHVASVKYNQWLSTKRAESVKAALVQFGVDASRIEAVGCGESRPIAPNDTPEGRARNRRVEFVPIPP